MEQLQTFVPQSDAADRATPRRKANAKDRVIGGIAAAILCPPVGEGAVVYERSELPATTSFYLAPKWEWYIV